jgi:hypothetical protein
MAKFVFTYSGGGPMPETDAEREAVMSAWTGWLGGLGAAALDPGNPFGASSTVDSSGVSNGGGSGLSGFSVVDAANIDAAVEMAKGCPIIGAGGSVEVHQALDM